MTRRFPSQRSSSTTSSTASPSARSGGRSRRWRPTPAPELLAAALDYAGRGWHVFPLVPGSKRPAVAGWPDRATTDPDRITGAWTHGAYGIGIATGPSRLVVIDLDTKPTAGATPDGPAEGRDGVAAWATLTADPAQPDHTAPATWTVTTPTGGRHLYFARPVTAHGGRPALGDLRNTQSLLAPGIDTRAAGGYVVAPPTTLPAGRYTITDPTPPAELPGWLVIALSPRAVPDGPAAPVTLAGIHGATEGAQGRQDAYLAAALAAETRRVATAAAGERNHALFCAALALGQLVAGGALPEQLVRDVLTDAARRHVHDGAYTARTAHRTITSGLRAGTRRPRTLNRAAGGAA